jgi:hypothetical protein
VLSSVILDDERSLEVAFFRGKLINRDLSFVAGSAVAAADTISAPWTPASSGPPPDANGSGSDTKNLDVGEISDVSRPCCRQLKTAPPSPRPTGGATDARVPFLLFLFPSINCSTRVQGDGTFPARVLSLSTKNTVFMVGAITVPEMPPLCAKI